MGSLHHVEDMWYCTCISDCGYAAATIVEIPSLLMTQTLTVTDSVLYPLLNVSATVIEIPIVWHLAATVVEVPSTTLTYTLTTEKECTISRFAISSLHCWDSDLLALSSHHSYNSVNLVEVDLDTYQECSLTNRNLTWYDSNRCDFTHCDGY